MGHTRQEILPTLCPGYGRHLDVRSNRGTRVVMSNFGIKSDGEEKGKSKSLSFDCKNLMEDTRSKKVYVTRDDFRSVKALFVQLRP